VGTHYGRGKGTKKIPEGILQSPPGGGLDGFGIPLFWSRGVIGRVGDSVDFKPLIYSLPLPLVASNQTGTLWTCKFEGFGKLKPEEIGGFNGRGPGRGCRLRGRHAVGSKNTLAISTDNELLAGGDGEITWKN